MVPSSWAENNNSPALTSQTALGDSGFFASERNPHSNKLTNNILHWWSHLGLNQGPAIYESSGISFPHIFCYNMD